MKNLEIGNIAPPMDNNDALRRILNIMANEDSDIIPKNFDVSTSGVNEIVGAISNQIIEVHSIIIHPSADVTVTLKSNGNAISPAFQLTAKGILILDYRKLAWYRGVKSGNLQINLGGGVQTVGTVYYKQSL